MIHETGTHLYESISLLGQEKGCQTPWGDRASQESAVSAEVWVGVRVYGSSDQTT